MSSHENPQSHQNIGLERAAVRSILAQQAEPTSKKAQTGAMVMRASRMSPDAAEAAGARVSEPKSAGHSMLRQTFRTLLSRIKTYRPDRKSILWTSLVLMLLLQPFFVIGWSLACIAAIGACYYFMGADRFWRRIIEAHRMMQARWPDAARQVKLSAYVCGKKWDRFLSRLPDGLATVLRIPDLRDLMAADAAHDAVMADRLTRINRDAAAS